MPPPTDLEQVVNEEIKEWHFHIYFHEKNAEEYQYALELREAILRLRRDGAFVAAPLFRVNTGPVGPHLVGSFQIWVPSSSFASVFSYLCQHRGELSVLAHPLTPEARKDHEFRAAWIGPSFPLDLAKLSPPSPEVPLQYPKLKLGYSAPEPDFTLEERRRIGGNVERILRGEKDAAHAPSD